MENNEESATKNKSNVKEMVSQYFVWLLQYL